MISKTLFIIGAGSGADINVPAGAELAKSISNLLDIRFDLNRLSNGDAAIAAAISNYASKCRIDANLFYRGARIIAHGIGLADSIDSFLDAHREDSYIKLSGKLAIAKAILTAERRSRLFIDPRQPRPIDFNQLGSIWLVKFFKMLTSGVSRSQIGRLFEKISIVNFNYDRCLEHFLVHAIVSKYSVETTEAAALVNRLDIMHPYGVVGPLPWSHANGVPFGEEDYPELLLAVAERIRTYTEQVSDQELISKIDGYLVEAQTLVFLGFGYHRQNLDILTPRIEGKPRPLIRIFGTAVGLSGADCEIIQNQINNMMTRLALNRAVQLLNNHDCGKFFDEYRRSISVE